MSANNTNISTYHLSAHPELYEPARDNAFEFLLTGLANSSIMKTITAAGVPAALATEDDEFNVQDVQEVIKLSVSQASVPHFSINSIPIRRGNSTMKFAGEPTFGDGSLKCHDYVGARTKDILLAWQALAYDVNEDVVHTADNYKFDCELIEYSPDYSYVLRRWLMKGCWISQISENVFTHESGNGDRMLDVSFVYDRAYPIIDKVEN